MKKFTEYLDDFSFDDLVALWNEYASENGYEQIYESIEEFAANFETEGAELARMVFFGDVKNWSDMVCLNGYGNFESCWNVENSPIDIDALAQWMKETNHHEYKEWLESIDADDLASNGLPLNFDIEDLAKELMADWHQTFDDFIEEHI